MKRKYFKYALALLIVLVSTTIILADELTTVSGKDPNYLKHLMEDLVLISGAVVIGVALLSLTYLVNALLKVQKMKLLEEKGIEVAEKANLVQRESYWQRLYKQWTNVVPVEKEKDILMDHNYDGIRELDNSLPPWWVAMFYITIFFAVVYFGYYHVFAYGNSSVEAYEAEMKKAEEDVKAFLATKADLVDETNVEVTEDEMALSVGQSLYETNCVACHGIGGEGGVGPNLTDEYWIHGGSVKDIFKTIKYGVPEKGMIAWKAQMRASDMQNVASYILTMQGTNPPNAKEPQGELYQPTASDVEKEQEDKEADDTIGMR